MIGTPEQKQIYNQVMFDKKDVATGETYLRTYGDLERLRGRMPEPRELLAYLKMFTGITIPYKPICPEHNCPADYLIESIYGNDWIMAISNRSGGKTHDAGVSVGMESYHRSTDVRILGGSGSQSGRMYEEFTQFLDYGFGDRVIGEPLQSKTLFTGGNKVSILVQSQTSVRGEHVPRVYLDEVEEFDPQVYEAALSICQTRGKAKARVDITSTRHRAGGLVTRLWNNWPSKKFIWCLFEVMERCPPERSCSTCLLAADCPGKEKMSQAVGYYLIDDAIKKKQHLSEEGWGNEWLCTEVRQGGLVYPTWNSKVHAAQAVPYNPDLPVVCGSDPGQTCTLWVQPRKVMVKGEPKTQYRFINEKRWDGVAPSRMIKDIDAIESKNGWPVKENYVDPSAAWFAAELEAAGRKVYPTENSVDKGIGMFRNALEQTTDDGEPLVLVDNVTCGRFIREMDTYQMKDGKIVKKRDHGPDTGRYIIASGAGTQEDKKYIHTV